MRDRPAPSAFANEIVQGIESFLREPSLSDLLRSFDPVIADVVASGIDLEDRLCALDEFTDRWDTRNGKERNEAGDLVLSEIQAELTLRSAQEFGLSGVSAPRSDHYDHLLILGGLVRACVARPLWAARLVTSGLRVGQVTALGGHREFRGDEFPLAALLGLSDVDDEFAALDAGTRKAFGLGTADTVSGERSEQPGGSWTLHTYESDIRVNVAAAPSSEPETRRANTADTFEWFGATLAQLHEGQSVLMVTTSIYVPAQQAAAMRMLRLPFGVTVETVGFEPGMVDVRLDQKFTPTNYLQEIRSTVRAFRALLTASQ